MMADHEKIKFEWMSDFLINHRSRHNIERLPGRFCLLHWEKSSMMPLQRRHVGDLRAVLFTFHRHRLASHADRIQFFSQHLCISSNFVDMQRSAWRRFSLPPLTPPEPTDTAKIFYANKLK